jgi:hypothetical protein
MLDNERHSKMPIIQSMKHSSNPAVKLTFGFFNAILKFLTSISDIFLFVLSLKVFPLAWHVSISTQPYQAKTTWVLILSYTRPEATTLSSFGTNSTIAPSRLVHFTNPPSSNQQYGHQTHH